MQQNWCQVSAENRQLRQDFRRVSAECRELRQTVSDLIQYRKWEELRRQCEEEDRRGWENALDTRIAAAEQGAREQVSQLRAYLFIYFISFNVIQPMWLCRQILKHKIADMSERRKQANKQKKTKQHT
jgi:uncharacterized coiled-coil DUF342 family protein